ncbi:MAG TPA: hypothetical protein VM370_02465 [Candidatus Thermoplasmatota archaeon]|nr:hypothetical protein [Candidatus Thermoplasmatota archaeon]
MSPRSSGHIVVGGASAAIGAACLVLGVMKPAALRADFLATPLWALAITSGLVLALAGALILVFTFRKPEELAPEVPAHVAFNSRMTIPDIVPHLAGLPRAAADSPPAPAPAAASVPAAAARLPAPAPVHQQRLAPRSDDLAAMDAQIRELTKKINKAGVMLATGQLSQQGYLAYVEDMKRQRAKLEAQRVRAELRT